ncbi:NAD(P)/FAD-dependent oxidoreductase [Sorangium sp. So ce1151]|uniref:NAD(P)/FAD-dependent oxidoreductase n=1 Tax=Sorangium sp. So ce1151 TaxID=3133332 RepID=UPI003F63BBC7
MLILGGGVAGTATALALQARGISTVVIERSHYAAARPGDTLLGATQILLGALGVWKQFLADDPAEAAPIVAVWGDGEPRVRLSILDPYGDGWHVDRRRFDAMLARAAEAAGVLVYCDVCPTRVERRRAGWRVRLRGLSGEGEVDTRFLVDATGRAAWLARRMGAQRRLFDCLVGVVAVHSRPPADAALLLEAAQDGWWYSIPLPSERALAAYMTDADIVAGADPRSLFRARLAATEHTRARLERLGEPSEVKVVPASTYDLDQIGGPRWAAVGDAAWGLDPLSGSGIHRALDSGLRAADAIERTLHGERNALSTYCHDMAARFTSELEARSNAYARERRWPASEFWRRRVQS